MQKSKFILYVDPQGKEHHALVTAINGLHPNYASLIYIDSKAPENANLKQVFDVVGKNPLVDVNYWSEIGEGTAETIKDKMIKDMNDGITILREQLRVATDELKNSQPQSKAKK